MCAISKSVPGGEPEQTRSIGPVITSETGTGRAVVVLVENVSDLNSGADITSALTSGRKIMVTLPKIGDDTWQEISAATQKLFDDNRIRQPTLIGIAAASTIALHRVLSEPKSVRALVLLNPTTRAHPSAWHQRLDALEAALPLGLPFRLEDRGFDARPYLHRIRCPVIVITTKGTSSYELEMAEEISARTPTAWHRHLAGNSDNADIAAAIAEIQDVPVKCPQ